MSFGLITIKYTMALSVTWWLLSHIGMMGRSRSYSFYFIFLLFFLLLIGFIQYAGNLFILSCTLPRLGEGKCSEQISRNGRIHIWVAVPVAVDIHVNQTHRTLWAITRRVNLIYLDAYRVVSRMLCCNWFVQGRVILKNQLL